MNRSLWMFLLAAIMTMTAVAFAAKSPFRRQAVGGCNSVCRTDADCTNPQCPFCAIFYKNDVKNGVAAIALCHAFGAK